MIQQYWGMFCDEILLAIPSGDLSLSTLGLADNEGETLIINHLFHLHVMNWGDLKLSEAHEECDISFSLTLSLPRYLSIN